MTEVSGIIILPPTMMLYAVVLSVIALYLNARYVKISPVTIIITLVLASGGISTVYTEFVGPAAIREQGQSYIYYAYAEFVIVLLFNMFGVVLGCRRCKKLPGEPTGETAVTGPPGA